MSSSIKKFTLFPLMLLATAIAAMAGSGKTFVNKASGSCIVVYQSVSGKFTADLVAAGESRKLEVDNPTPESICVIHFGNGTGALRTEAYSHWNVKDIEKSIYTFDDKGMTASDR
jgi:hypothetical protein